MQQIHMLTGHMTEPLGLHGKMQMAQLYLQHSLSIKILVVYGLKKLPDFIRWVINNKNNLAIPYFENIHFRGKTFKFNKTKIILKNVKIFLDKLRKVCYTSITVRDESRF